MRERRVITRTITPTRIKALRYIAEHPGCLVGAVAQAVLARSISDGTKRAMWSQAATRNGAGYCKQLAEMGLVTIETFKVRSGYGHVTLSATGHQAVAAAVAKAEAAATGLDMVLERCINGDTH